MKFTPHQYQERAIKFGIERACAGFFLEPGMGKTSIMFAIMVVLKRMKLINKILVLAPLRVVYSTWPAECQKWDDFAHLSIGILHGPNKDKVLAEDHDIYLMNYEGLNWLNQSTKRNWAFDMLIIDESSKVKSTNTQRFKTLKQMIGKFKRRYILTGSPAANSLMDLFGQVFCMDQGATFGPYITSFKNDYFFQSGYNGYDWTMKPGADLLIHAALAPRVMRLDAKDYLELPELIEIDIKVDLPKDAYEQYKSMENKLKIDMLDGTIVASNAAVASMKCRQIANGALYSDTEHGQFVEIHDAKIEALKDLLDELEGQPALIAYDFEHDLIRLKEALGKDTPHIGSGVSPNKAKEIIAAWNRGEIPYLLGQPLSMSHGLNMQEAGRAVIWFGLTWSLENREQFIRRVWRQGVGDRVFVYNIIANKTVDLAIMEAVKIKDQGQQALLSALRNYWNKEE